MAHTTNACVLGATGTIGFELTVALIASGCSVVAVVRNTEKLRGMLSEREVDHKGLAILERDLFAQGVTQEMIDCDYIFNAASKPVSFAPWSSVNRQWDSAVSSLTRQIVESGTGAHVVAFCGPEYFSAHDGEVGLFQRAATSVANRLSAALRDNHDEALWLLGSGYERWSVLRCGSIREASGKAGMATSIGTSLHDDGSDYRAGKGKALVVEDFATWLAELVRSGGLVEFEREMPFVFNRWDG